MVRSSSVLLCLVMFVFLLVSPTFADRSTEYLQSVVVEAFDSPTGDADSKSTTSSTNHRWIVRGSKFITEGFPKYSWVKTYPTAAFPDSQVNQDLKSLGVQGAFDRVGYNYLEFVPVEAKDGADGKPVESAITLPGRVKQLDIWAWGSNYKYYLEIQLRDWRGMIHTVRLGDLNYIGWKNLSIQVPPGIPQDVRYVPSRKGLELVKIVMWTYPDEKVNGFKLYLDQIKILTDTFETPYDGSVLGDEKTVDTLWQNGSGTVDPKKTSGGK
jgi:hypothetical protein